MLLKSSMLQPFHSTWRIATGFCQWRDPLRRVCLLCSWLHWCSHPCLRPFLTSASNQNRSRCGKTLRLGPSTPSPLVLSWRANSLILSWLEWTPSLHSTNIIWQLRSSLTQHSLPLPFQSTCPSCSKLFHSFPSLLPIWSSRLPSLSQWAHSWNSRLPDNSEPMSLLNLLLFYIVTVLWPNPFQLITQVSLPFPQTCLHVHIPSPVL